MKIFKFVKVTSIFPDGPAVNGLCPIGVNIGGQCYALGG